MVACPTSGKARRPPSPARPVPLSLTSPTPRPLLQWDSETPGQSPPLTPCNRCWFRPHSPHTCSVIATTSCLAWKLRELRGSPGTPTSISGVFSFMPGSHLKRAPPGHQSNPFSSSLLSLNPFWNPLSRPQKKAKSWQKALKALPICSQALSGPSCPRLRSHGVGVGGKRPTLTCCTLRPSGWCAHCCRLLILYLATLLALGSSFLREVFSGVPWSPVHPPRRQPIGPAQTRVVSLPPSCGPQCQ